MRITADGVEEIGEPSTVVHDGHVVYVQNKTTWDALYLYMWGDVNDLNGAWPGMVPTGTEKIDGVEYTYFDMGEANTGLNENLIFNNGSGTQLKDYNVTLDKDYFLVVTDDGVSEAGAEPDEPVDPEDPAVEPVDYTIFVDDQTGWGALSLYAWGDIEAFGGWPGAASTDVVIGGKPYKSFAMSGNGEAINLIFNDNGAGTQLADYAITVDRNYYLQVTAAGVTEIETPSCRVYVDDQTGWEAIALYAWGDAEAFGGWPGALPAGTETIDGVSYKYFELTADGGGYNLIFNNNGGGTQVEGKEGQYIIANSDYYFQVTTDNCVRVK